LGREDIAGQVGPQIFGKPTKILLMALIFVKKKKKYFEKKKLK